MSDLLATPRHVDYGTRDFSTRKVMPVLKKDPQFVPLFILNTPMGDYRRHHVTGDELVGLYGLETLNPASRYTNHATIMCSQLLQTGNSVVIQRAKGVEYIDPENPDAGLRDAKVSKFTLYLAYRKSDSGIYIRDLDGKAKVDVNGQPEVYALPTEDETSLKAIKATSGMKYYRRDNDTWYIFKLTDELTPEESSDSENIDDDEGTGKWVKQDTMGDNKIDVYESALLTKRVEDDAPVVTYTADINGKEVTFVPLYTFEAEAHGKGYDNYGIALEPLIGETTDTNLRDKERSLAFRLRVFNKESGSKQIVKTTDGGDDIKFTLKPYAVDPVTGAAIGLEDLFPSSYGNYIDPNRPLQPYIFKEISLHSETDFLNALQLFIEEENKGLQSDVIDPVVPGLADFTVVDPADADAVKKLKEDYQYLVNFMTRKYTNGVEYETLREFGTVDIVAFRNEGFAIVDSAIDIPVYLQGGEDGIVDDLDLFEEQVVTEIQRYADPDDPVNSIALNRDTVFIDSGYKMENKLKLAPYISNRTDTLLLLSTYEFSKEGTLPTITDELNRANLLKSVIGLYTESKAFGTPTMRAAIFMGSGKLANRLYRYRMPVTLDWAYKAMKYYGPMDGNWNTSHEFSTQDNNIITELVDLEPKYIPKSVKDKLWTAGLVWFDNEDEVKFFYPGQQTIYPYDTSILNSIKTVIAACTIHRVNDKVWRTYSGVDTMTDLELKMAAERLCDNLLRGRFDNAIKYVPEIYYTARDEQLGWLWRLRVHMYANNMKTVMYSDVEALRMSDYNSK